MNSRPSGPSLVKLGASLDDLVAKPTVGGIVVMAGMPVDRLQDRSRFKWWREEADLGNVYKLLAEEFGKESNQPAAAEKERLEQETLDC